MTTDQGAGGILIRRHDRARRLGLRIDRRRALAVCTAPMGASARQIDQFISHHQAGSKPSLTACPSACDSFPAASCLCMMCPISSSMGIICPAPLRSSKALSMWVARLIGWKIGSCAGYGPWPRIIWPRRPASMPAVLMLNWGGCGCAIPSAAGEAARRQAI